MPKWTKSKTARYFYKDYKYKKKIDRKKYRAILNDFFKLIQSHLIEGNIYSPPYGMGQFRIAKTKFKKSTIRNYGIEREYYKKHNIWKKIKLHNFHTEGYMVKLTWYKLGFSKIPSSVYYHFSTNVPFRKRISNYLLSTGNINNYYVTKKKIKLKDNKTLI